VAGAAARRRLLVALFVALTAGAAGTADNALASPSFTDSPICIISSAAVQSASSQFVVEADRVLPSTGSMSTLVSRQTMNELLSVLDTGEVLVPLVTSLRADAANATVRADLSKVVANVQDAVAASRTLHADVATWASSGASLAPSDDRLARTLAAAISRSADATSTPFGAAWLTAYDASTGDPHPTCRTRGYATVGPANVAGLVATAVRLQMIDALNGNAFFTNHVTWLEVYLVAGPQNWSRLTSITTAAGHTYPRGKGKIPSFGPVGDEASLGAATLSVDSLGHWYCERLIFHGTAAPTIDAC